jgi:hypothetical protein
MAVTWRANSALPIEVREVLEKAVHAYPPEWLDSPCDDEVFDELDDCERRLLAYSLAQGFDVVRTHSKLNGKSQNVTFQCIFHGAETRNYRGLEQRVSRDKDDKITSRRQREATAIRKTDCRWRCKASYKSVGKRGTEPRAWILKVESLYHSGHDLVDNPLMFPRHKQRTDEFRLARRQALAHRSSVIPYSVHRRILDANDEYQLKLTAKEYYNSIRNETLNGEDPQTIEGLLIALDNAGFIHRCRYKDVVDEQTGKVISRKLVQIWFTHQDLIDAAARFVAGSVCSIDATFNTNKARMPIIIAVGVLNDDSTFPIAFSWTPAEDHESYCFFWRSFLAHLPTNCSPPSVVISDQAPAILSSINECIPSARHQICAWHAVEAMLAAFRRHGHTDRQIRGNADSKSRQDNEEEVEGLRALAWAYVKSPTVEDLAKNRSILILHLLKPTYIDEVWRTKEDRIIYCYTRQLHNLGARSSQRVESYHPVFRQVLNGQLPLETAATRLCQRVNTAIVEMKTAEDNSMRRYPRVAEDPLFINLRFRVTEFALTKVALEYSELARAMNETDADLGPCNCEVLLAFSLPCRHYLLRAWRTNEPLPRSLFHPRWWIRGPPITIGGWKPSWETPDVFETTTRFAPTFTAEKQEQIASIRAALRPEELHRFDRQREALESRLEIEVIAIGQQHLAFQQLTVGQPDPVPKRAWKKKDRCARGMTANEIGAQQARQQARIEQQNNRFDVARQQQALQAWNDTIEVVRTKTPDRIPDSPTAQPPTILIAGTPERAPINLAIRTPERPRPKRDPSPEASSEQERQLPASTAPPVLGRGNRKRARHWKLVESRAQGRLPESQPRE